MSWTLKLQPLMSNCPQRAIGNQYLIKGNNDTRDCDGMGTTRGFNIGNSEKYA